ncbi:MAG: type II toxin-antitoxin system death-on-curing family toxin [Balneolaceae bacterium]|nr:MAG: type II toxin-antitoxin system death-on-curing family toxin [Balneolaceae bacterium]
MIKFLKIEMILSFHDDQINQYGGNPGIRDKGLLESALAQPEASFGGEYVHKDIFEMAAAYGFHICKNHPFIDGNKRTALIAMYTFLYVNGWQLKADKKVLYATIMELASGNLTKEELTDFLKKHSEKRL